MLCPKTREIPAWCHFHLERRLLLSTGHALHLLANAFSRLENLRVVGLHNREIKRSQRDGEDKAQRGYGWSMPGVNPRTGRPLVAGPRCSFRHSRPPDPILPLVLHALTRAGARPRSIEVDSLKNLSATCLSITFGPLAQSILSAMSELRVLRLSLRNQRMIDNVHGAEKYSLYGLQPILQRTPLLEYLRLDFGLNELEAPKEFLSWLSLRSNPTIRLPAIVRLEYLATLELGMLTLPSQTLLNLVSKFPSLTTLVYRTVTLEDDSTATASSIWPSFLLDLAHQYEFRGARSMASLSICNPGYKHLHSSSSRRVYFVTSDLRGRSGMRRSRDRMREVLYCKLSDGDFCVWLRDLACRTGVEDANDYMLSPGLTYVSFDSSSDIDA